MKFLIILLITAALLCSVLLVATIIADVVRAKNAKNAIQEYRLASVEKEILEIKHKIEKKRR